MKCGVVLFDDPDMHDTGWAAWDGGEPRRIRSTGDLPTDVVWLTNLGFDQFFASGLNASPRFRIDSYLRVTLPTIRRELGLDSVAPGPSAQHLSAVFRSTMVAAERLGLEDLPSDSLAAGFRQLFLPNAPDKPAVPADIADAVKRACQSWQRCERPVYRKHGPSLITVSFVRHRCQHALDILALPEPKGIWRPIDALKLPSDLEELKHYPRPILAQVIIREIEPRFAPIVSPGGGAAPIRKRGRKGAVKTDNPRDWMAHPELVLLKQFADIEIVTAVEAEHYAPPPITVAPLSAAEASSYSFGLAMENAWVSLTKTSDGRAIHDPRAAFVQAVDRAKCMAAALELVKRDESVVISGFGYGRITAMIQDPGTQLGRELGRLVKGTDLVPAVVADYPDEGFPMSRDAPPAELHQAIAIRGQRDFHFQLDAAVTKILEQQLDAQIDAPGDAEPAASEQH